MLKNVSAACSAPSFSPHATIRPVLTTDEELKAAPAGFQTAAKAKSGKQYHVSIIVDQLDCLECGSCVNVCPVQALTMVPNTDEERQKMDLWYYGTEQVAPKANPQNRRPSSVLSSKLRSSNSPVHAQAAVKHRMSNSSRSSSAIA